MHKGSVLNSKTAIRIARILPAARLARLCTTLGAFAILALSHLRDHYQISLRHQALRICKRFFPCILGIGKEALASLLVESNLSSRNRPNPIPLVVLAAGITTSNNRRDHAAVDYYVAALDLDFMNLRISHHVERQNAPSRLQQGFRSLQPNRQNEPGCLRTCLDRR